MKKKLTYYLLLVFLTSVTGLSLAQETPLKNNHSGDTAAVNHLNDSATKYMKNGQLDQTMVFAIKAELLSKKTGYKAGLSKSNNIKGRILYRKGRYPEALDCLTKALAISEEINDSVLQSTSLNNMGNAYAYMGDHVKALNYYLKGLTIEERIKIQNNLHWYYNNIGNIYNEQKDYKKGLEYSLKAITVEERIKDKHALSVTFSNVGGLYSALDKNDSALYYYVRAVKLSEEVKDTFSIALSLSNSALMYSKLKRYNSATEFAQRGLKIATDKGMKDIIIFCLKTLGEVEQGMKRYDNSEKYFKQIRDLSIEMQAKILTKDAYYCLANLYSEKGDYEAAYDNYKLFSEVKDTLLNEDNSKLITEMNTKYTTEKKEKEIELLKKNEDIQKLELAKRKNELNKQRMISIGTFAGFILLVIVATLFFSRYRLKKKANDQLQSAYNLIEEKNNTIEKSNVMITDSITYAKRIQDAILPAKEDLTRLFLENFFILYKPSQIVSGDFYWCSIQKNKIIFVVADCTGHGVPGAFMSMIGNTLLNEIVNEGKVTCTKKIAELLDEKIIHSLHQNEGTENYDGMDISICSIDIINKEIQFTGAHHAMYTYNGHLEKIKGDPFSIGGALQQKTKKFTSQKIEYMEGLNLYFLTDGYCDQSGGKLNKRFSSKQFEQLLEKVHNDKMNEQKETFEEAFDNWKGSTIQRDDVLVVGIKCPGINSI